MAVMRFQIKESELPAKALRRICRERVAVALDYLRESERPAAVHGARKEIKKVRALFRLLRGEISAGKYRRGVKALRAAADCLAARRDARVMLRAFRKLAGRDAGKYGTVERDLKKHARREARRFRQDHSLAVAGRWLRRTQRRVGKLKINLAGWAAIAPGLKASYQRGREACRLVQRRPEAENFPRMAPRGQRPLVLFLPAAIRLPGGHPRGHRRARTARRAFGRRS